MKILIADDDVKLTGMLKTHFTTCGYTVSAVFDGATLVKEIKANAPKYSLIILDVNMPFMDGLEACRKIREFSDIPIIMLTSAKEDLDKIIGLELGADDYLAKPFNIRELQARVKSIIRRANPQSSNKSTILPSYEFNGWLLNTADRTLINSNGVEIIISSGIYTLLLVFLQNPQRILSRDLLMNLSQSKELDAFDRTIDVQISRIRKKIESDPKNPSLIKTVRSGGYIFTPTVKQQ